MKLHDARSMENGDLGVAFQRSNEIFRRQLENFAQRESRSQNYLLGDCNSLETAEKWQIGAMTTVY